ncbi:TPA: lipopolysaccharide heptosyltransferase family protein, partial [Vibrio cholerae]|nr:lipopolysaccharide heptosyltransferase family protein [Vibrio cholerae]
LNSQGKHIAFCPPPADDKANQENMSRIDMKSVLTELAPWLRSVQL